MDGVIASSAAARHRQPGITPAQVLCFRIRIINRTLKPVAQSAYRYTGPDHQDKR
jgi:hypothetical protein